VSLRHRRVHECPIYTNNSDKFKSIQTYGYHSTIHFLCLSSKNNRGIADMQHPCRNGIFLRRRHDRRHVATCHRHDTECRCLGNKIGISTSDIGAKRIPLAVVRNTHMVMVTTHKPSTDEQLCSPARRGLGLSIDIKIKSVSVCLSVCLCVCLSVCLSVCLRHKIVHLIEFLSTKIVHMNSYVCLFPPK
jgi:hypothetical protein